MRFHLPSFLLGYGAGAASVLLGKRLRPFLVEAATAVYRMIDALGVRFAVQREDLEDLLAEAQAKARARRRPRRQEAESPAAANT